MYNRILLPTDGSACSEQAVEQGLQLAKLSGASVTFLYVVEDPFGYLPNAAVAYASAYEELQNAGRKILADMLGVASRHAVQADTRLITGALSHPADSIIKESEEYDLVVMATHGRRGFDRWFVGSVTEGVLRRAKKPLLVVRCEEN